MNKLIVRVKGGLGNQLFCYAAAHGFARQSQAELVIDDRSGFVRDSTYKREYMLGAFNIGARLATPAERLEPFERARRAILKYRSKLVRIDCRPYVEENGRGFDERLMHLKPRHVRFIDGLWQSERYFADVADEIRDALQMSVRLTAEEQDLSDEIRGTESIAIHVRFFGECVGDLANYYSDGLRRIHEVAPEARAFVFTDRPELLGELSNRLPAHRLVAGGASQRSTLADFYLMRQAKHFLIANSTFSWWAAWLGERSGKVVCAPSIKQTGLGAWGFDGLLPNRWIVV